MYTNQNQKNEYPQENTGVLFEKENMGNPKSPTHTGHFTDENGKKWQLAAWTKVSRSGQNFISLKVSEFRDQQGAFKSHPSPDKPPRNLPPVYQPKKYAPMKSALDHEKEEIPF